MPKNDTMTSENIDKFMTAATNETQTISSPIGQILLTNEKKMQGYYTKNGDIIEPCPDGRPKVPDETKGELVCVSQKPQTTAPQTTAPPSQAQTNNTSVIIAVVCAFVFFVGVAYGVAYFACKQSSRSKTTKKRNVFSGNGLEQQQLLQKAAIFPPRQLCPATVSFEYHLLPGDSI
jgi:hypothetical protein